MSSRRVGTSIFRSVQNRERSNNDNSGDSSEIDIDGGRAAHVEPAPWDPSKGPVLLSNFTVEETDGGSYSNNYSVDNILSFDGKVYCSKKGGNVNVVLRYNGKSPFVITHLLVKAPEHDFSAPIGDGLVFVSDEYPDIEASAIYDDFDLSHYQTLLDGVRCDDEPRLVLCGGRRPTTSTSSPTTVLMHQDKWGESMLALGGGNSYFGHTLFTEHCPSKLKFVAPATTFPTSTSPLKHSHDDNDNKDVKMISDGSDETSDDALPSPSSSSRSSSCGYEDRSAKWMVEFSKRLKPQDPSMYFEMKREWCLMQQFVFPRSGRYIHIKLLRSRNAGENIDIQFIGFKGYEGPVSSPSGQLS
eukprot:TRINITY_DN14686_c0_g1_i1.p1 TRINITY_DN14686_c0_g1~~TRINITY_DN14686_c0_g1_i1.p1  ORF type:complete len:357 (-),score=63.06 TRINITY_DN14686_c0_g1_i1:86-1156(-)